MDDAELTAFAKDWPRLKDLTLMIDAQITHETTLVSQRVTWLVISETFLFNVWLSIPRSPFVGFQKSLLFYVVGSVGFVTATLAWLATGAALRVQQQLIEARNLADQYLRATLPRSIAFVVLPRMGLDRVGPMRHTALLGNATAICLPPLFTASWIAIGMQHLLLHVWPRLAASPALSIGIPLTIGAVFFSFFALRGLVESHRLAASCSSSASGDTVARARA